MGLGVDWGWRICEGQKEVESMSILKKMVLLGVGAATVTKEKAEEIAEELIKRGEVASGEKAKVIDEIQQKAQAATTEIRKMVDERVEALSKKFRWLDDMRKLQGQVQELNGRLEQLEKTLKEREGRGN
jgi:polyhydroxyalkanoate synthesis regulator phasin